MADDTCKPETTDVLDEVTASTKIVEKSLNRRKPEDFSERVVYPEELNKFLQGRIRELTKENECLRRAFEEAEEKLRQLSQEKLNSRRTTTTGTESSMNKLIEHGKKYRSAMEDNGEGKDSGNNMEKGEDERIKCLKNKLQWAQTKLCESRNTCATLRQEIKIAQKLLCSEVGKNVSVTTLSSVPGGWRGRAEQIRNLQQKVTELNIKLSELSDKFQKGSPDHLASLDRQNLANLRIIEKERRQQIENTAKELRQAEVALEASKRKLDASKARIKVLEHELNVARGNVAMLNEKRCHDDRLIEALSGRLKIAEVRYQEYEVEAQNKKHKCERENANIKNELQAMQLQVDRLRRRLEEREIEIDKLRNEVASDESFKCRTSLSSGLRSPEERQISRPVSPRNLGEPNEYVTLALTAEAERVRLLELITLLNQRLDKEKNEAISLEESLREEKRKCARSESKLRDSEKKRVGLAKVDSGYRAKSRARSTSCLQVDEEVANSEKDFRIELLEEECLALKARLDTVQQDKANDLAVYKRMLDQARQTFKDACRSKALADGSRSTITI